MKLSLYISTIRTPLGLFSLATNESGAVAGTAFGGVEQLHRRLSRHDFVSDERATHDASEQIFQYFAGERTHFDLPLAANGSTFQERVWAALRAIPFGTTQSYGAVARTLQSSPRAVGRANATNPICLIVPCHRVVGADGSLTGFAFGERIKRRLLSHEASVAAPQPVA